MHMCDAVSSCQVTTLALAALLISCHLHHFAYSVPAVKGPCRFAFVCAVVSIFIRDMLLDTSFHQVMSPFT